MKITIYTTTNCEFSKQEKEYLKTNNLIFEEKNLETNREFLTEMMALSNNFAGTPITKIEKDDGQIVVLKGFTKEEFDKTFVTPPVIELPVQPVIPQPTPVAPEPTPPAPKVEETPVASPVPEIPIVNPDPLNSILADLQKAQGAQTPQVNQPSSPSLTGAQPPPIPDFKS